MPVDDATAGFKCYRRSVVENLLRSNVTFVGYAFQIEMKFKAYNLKYKLYEIPIIFTDRIRGQSKLNLSIIYEAVFGLISMKFGQIFSKMFK